MEGFAITWPFLTLTLPSPLSCLEAVAVSRCYPAQGVSILIVKAPSHRLVNTTSSHSSLYFHRSRPTWRCCHRVNAAAAAVVLTAQPSSHGLRSGVIRLHHLQVLHSAPCRLADSRTKVNDVESTTQDDDDFGDHYTALLSEAQDAYTDKEPPFLVSHPGAEITRVVRLQNNQTGEIHFEQVRKPESQPDFPYIICLIVADYNSGARRVPRGSGHSRTIKAKDTFSNISGKEAVDTVRGWGLINNSKTRP